MKKWATTLILSVFFTACSWVGGENPDHRLYDLARKKEIRLSSALPEISKHRVILVGELHDNKTHHLNQLRIIQAVFDAGVPVAVGLEMFRSDSQNALDDWVSGKMGIEEFQKIYYDNWNFPWPLYRPILEYAREKKIPLVGLNVSREITRQVARMGFSSLSETQKGKLKNVTCRVDKEYMDFIRKVFGTHAHGHLNFTYFCEAQLVWDNVMAVNTLEFLNANPEHSMIVVTGSGHASKKGVPEQIRKRSRTSWTVILPEVPGTVDVHTITDKDADYIMMEQ